MMQYQFAAPVTLNLNFSLPIIFLLLPYQNLLSQNLQSMNYFKNIPFDISLARKSSSDRLQFNLSVINYPGATAWDMECTIPPLCHGIVGRPPGDNRGQV